MEFEYGTATSTFDLMEKLTAFMSTVSGWTLISSPEKRGNAWWDHDKVYYSTGSSGRNAIYIRQRVGEVEPFVRGAQQYDYGNGDTGFLNFFTYAHFPNNGDGYAGASEAGRFGPRMYYSTGGAYPDMWCHDILSSKPGGAPHIIVGTPDSETSPADDTPDPHCQERRRWDQITSFPYYYSATGRDWHRMISDGHRYLYAFTYDPRRVERYTMARKGGHYNSDGTIDGMYSLGVFGFYPKYCIFVEERSSRRPYLYVFGDSDECMRINLLDNSQTAISTFTWPGGAVTSDGMGASCWDGGNFIYILRSNNTGDWACYNISADSWRVTQSPDDSDFPAISGYSISARQGLNFIGKHLSGFQYNRLYIAHDFREVLYIDLDDNTGHPASGATWTSHGEMISNDLYETRGDLLANQHGRMIHVPFYVRRVMNGIYEAYPNQPFSHLMFSDFKSSGYMDWRAVDSCYRPQLSGSGSGGEAEHEIIDGYACRVKTSIDSETDYIFIADEDRVIVATRSNSLRNPSDPDNVSEWSMAYMGAFDSSYNVEPYGELSSSVKSGFSRKVKLNNTEGTFTTGRYFIIDTTGANYTEIHPVWNGLNRFVKSESIVVEMVETNDSGEQTITISPKHDYSAGSKIAVDPLPTGVYFWELEKFQTTNISNREYDDLCGSDSTVAQTYTCSIPEDIVENSAGVPMDTRSEIPLWEYILSNSEREGEHNAREVRGKMIGVYALSKNSGIEKGNTIGVGDDVYFVIELPGHTKLMAIGPIDRVPFPPEG